MCHRLDREQATDAIVSPVKIEFLCGVNDPHEMMLVEVFLAKFHVIDDSQTLKQDWEEAARIAKRVVDSTQRRDFGDCLINAIANRLNRDV